AGHHLNRAVYGSTTPLEIMRMTRTPGNLLNTVGRRFDQRLQVSWEEGEGVTPAEHYQGFARGPAWAVDTLIRENFADDPGSASRFGARQLRVALHNTARRLHGRPLEALNFDEQSEVAEHFLKETSEGRNVVSELGPWSRSAAGEYRSVSYLLGLPGEFAHFSGLASPWLVMCGLGLAGLGACRLSRRQNAAPQRAYRFCSE